MLGLDELVSDPRYEDNAGRVNNRRTLRYVLEGVLAQRPGEEWLTLLGAVGVPCGAVNTIDQAFAYADAPGLEPVVTLTRSDGSSTQSVANPIRMSETPPAYRSAPPHLAVER